MPVPLPVVDDISEDTVDDVEGVDGEDSDTEGDVVEVVDGRDNQTLMQWFPTAVPRHGSVPRELLYRAAKR